MRFNTILFTNDKKNYTANVNQIVRYKSHSYKNSHKKHASHCI